MELYLLLILVLLSTAQCDLVPTCLQCPLSNLSTILNEPFADLESKLLVQVTSQANEFEYRVSLTTDTDRFFSLGYSSIGEASSALDPVLCPLSTSLPGLQDIQHLDASTVALDYKLQNCANFRMETTMFNHSQTIEVAGESLFLSESSNKLSFIIDNWLFSPMATNLDLNLSLSFRTPNEFNVTLEDLDGQKILFFTEADGTIWTFRLLEKVEVDGQVANCTVDLFIITLSPIFQANLVFSFPRFSKSLVYDPDWGVLMPQSGSETSSTSQTKTSSQSSTYFDFPGDTSQTKTSSGLPSNGTLDPQSSSKIDDGAHSSSLEDLHQESTASSFFTPLTIGIIAVIASAIIAIIIGFIIVHVVVRRRRGAENSALGFGKLRMSRPVDDYQGYTPPQTQRSGAALLPTQ